MPRIPRHLYFELMRQFRPVELAAHIQSGHTPVLLDVREPWEWNYLETAGFGDVVNLSGGMAAWSDEVDPAMPRY
jgi:rhodanese-related sulfurtransferase